MSDSSSNNSCFTSDSYIMGHNTNDSIQAGELESLIQVLQDKINTRDPTVRTIKYPQLLISSLIELNYLVGMDRLKDSIALQVMRLIAVSYTHLRAHETRHDLVCRLLL